MINFRFHLVSLIAVFLALGLGILVGSTVIDQSIVNRLDSEIDSVRHENKVRAATNKELAQQNSDLQDFIDATAPYAGDARLDGQSIAIVAERGLDSDVVKQTQLALRAAGAEVPAVLWLEDAWQLDSESRVQDLQTALDLRGNASATRDAALGLLARRLANRPATARRGASTSTSTPRSPSIDAVTALEQAGFLRVTDGDASAFDAFPTQHADVLVITGDDSHFLGSGLTSAFVRSLVDAAAPTVVAAAYDAGSDPTAAPERGAVLASVLDDRALSRAVSTVDDLEMAQGRLATVLTFQIAGSGNIGHYGYGAGASAPLPPHRA